MLVLQHPRLYFSLNYPLHSQKEEVVSLFQERERVGVTEQIQEARRI